MRETHKQAISDSKTAVHTVTEVETQTETDVKAKTGLRVKRAKELST